VSRPDHRPEGIRLVCGDEVEPLGIGPVAQEGAERAVERIDREPLRLERVEHLELRVDAGGEGVRPEQTRAEAVDGRDVRPLGLPCLVPRAEVEQARAHAPLELGGGLLGEGDREDGRDVDAVVHHGPGEALDQNRRLAGPSAGADEQGAVAAVDGLALLLGEVELRHSSTRQIEGWEQPPRKAQESGVQRSSPRAIAAAVSRRRSRARSSAAWSSSRLTRSPR
jgi:hypothetical protein